jgi:hypothetical protein
MEQKRRNKLFYTVPFTWDRTLWVITFAFFAMWLGMSGYFVYAIHASADVVEPICALVVFNLLMLPIVLLCEGFAPQRLEIGADRIVILRRYKSIVLEREMIKSVERLPDGALRGAIRTFGVGGLFGYYGSYYTRSLGSFTLYATSFKSLYLIKKWDGKSIVISCAEPDKMDMFL